MVLTIFELKEHFVRQQFMLKKAPKTVLWGKHIEHDCRHRRVRRTSGSTLRIIGNEPNEINVFSDGLRRRKPNHHDDILNPKKSFQDGSENRRSNVDVYDF